MLRAFRHQPDVQRTSPFESGAWTFSTGPLGSSGSAWCATDESALAIPAFWRAVQLRAEVLSTLPIHAEIGGKLQPDVHVPILEQPDPSEDRSETLSRMAISLVLRGEYVCLLGDFDDDGFPHALKVIDPDSADLLNDGSWRVGSTEYPRDQILHRIGTAFPGATRGADIIRRFSSTIQGELAAVAFQRNFYRDGGAPTVVITANKPGVTPEALRKYKDFWMEKMSGRREPVVVPGDVSVENMSLSNHDSQFIEGRQFSLTDVANIVGVPPYFIGAPGSNMTYTNVSDERRNLLDFYLRGDLYAIERGLSSLVPDGVKAKYDTGSFLRLDPKASADTLSVQAQWMTIDEIREVNGLPPLPDGQGKVLGSLVLPGAPQDPSSNGEQQ